MALSKVDYNSLNVTPAASKALKWNSTPNGFETGDVAGSMVLLATATASSDSTITFDSDIDDTYKEYVFKMYDIHPQTDLKDLQVNFRDGGSSYDATKTTSVFRTYADEAGTDTTFSYNTSWDVAQGTGVQLLIHGIDNDNDACGVATMHLFDPSSTTFVKHFVSTSNAMNGTYTHQQYVAGYCNVTAAIDGVQFSMSSGNIDAGTFKMYGVT